MCRTATLPSSRLLGNAVFAAAARYDFDAAVCLFGESVETLLEERVERVARSRPKNVKATEFVPRWTLGELLHISAHDDDDADAAGGDAIGPRADHDAEPLSFESLDWGE